MSCFSQEFYLGLNFSVTRKRRKIIEAIYKGYRSKSDIAWYAKCTPRAVYDFFVDCMNPEHILHNLLTIEGKQEDWTGKTLPNKITIDPGYLKALIWLEINGYLCSPNWKKDRIIGHFQSTQKLPPLHRKTSSPLKDIKKDKEKETKKEKAVWINPILEVNCLDRDAQLWATKHASDCEIWEALESCRWKIKQGIKIKHPSAYFIGTLKNKMRASKENTLHPNSSPVH